MALNTAILLKKTAENYICFFFLRQSPCRYFFRAVKSGKHSKTDDSVRRRKIQRWNVPTATTHGIMPHMNSKSVFAISLTALICGSAIGYYLRPSGESPNVKTEVASKPKRSTKADDADILLLQRRIRELERQLAKREPQTQQTAPEMEKPADATTTNATTRAERRGPPTAAEMRARMEEMRKNDPQRYAQMTNHFARMRQRNLNRVQNQLDILGSVDRSRLTKAEQDIHDQYQEAVARREELREMINPQNEDVTEEQRREVFRELRELDQLTQRLAESERNTLLTQTVRDMGVKESEAGEFVETISAIYEATQTHMGPGGPGPRPGGPPPVR